MFRPLARLRNQYLSLTLIEQRMALTRRGISGWLEAKIFAMILPWRVTEKGEAKGYCLP